MLRITSLCNAGFSLEYEDHVLLIDVPCRSYGPYYGLPDEVWDKICKKQSPYNQVCGIYITHDHPDHCDKQMLAEYQKQYPQIPVFLPSEKEEDILRWGPFVLEYAKFPHAPMLQGVPPHVVTWIKAGEKEIYLSADAALEAERHRSFIGGRKAELAIWNAMYLSRADTRALLRDTSPRNVICHMPKERGDWAGIWKKCENNFRRYPEELQTVQVLEGYPTVLEL